MTKNVVKIQHFYRCYSIKKILKLLKTYDLNNKNNIKFNEYSKLICKKSIINKICELLTKLNVIFGSDVKLGNLKNSRIILTAFLLNNFTKELLGNENDHSLIDKQILDWSSNITKFLSDYENITYLHLQKLNLFINNFYIIFDQWKTVDRERTVQNIIISYYNRKKHIKYILEKDDKTNNDNVLKTLEEECDILIKDIKIIDPNFDIEYLKENYESVHESIKNGMEIILNSITSNFKKAYLDLIIKEFKQSNYKVLNELFLEVNQRIIKITPDKIKKSIIEKLGKYNFVNMLLEDEWNTDIKNYINFIIDTIYIYSSYNDDNENKLWKDKINDLFNKNYHENLPLIIFEINNKIDKIYNFILQNK